MVTGFNAAVAGCFFAIETVLRPLRAENSPPFTTAMIILASVISSTVSNALLGTQSAFTVPSYDLKSAAELPLYLILGMLCGAVSVVFSRLVTWFTKSFEFIKDKFGLPAIVCPALGGLGAGMIALKYPGILYWGFTNVEEILHTGKSASAPGIWLLAQLAAAKVVATALCKGSGLVGGLYAPSLMIGAAVGAVFGGSAAEIINRAIPGNAAVAQPQAYALVGMAATLASMCSVPLTSVLLLFELTKDYRILLPLMGAVGLAIWVPSVANQGKESDSSEGRSTGRGYSSLSPSDRKTTEGAWRHTDNTNSLELSVIENPDHKSFLDEETILEELKVFRVMSKNYVKVSLGTSLREARKILKDSHQNCLMVVDEDEFLAGILTQGDIRRYLSSKVSTILDGTTASSMRQSRWCSTSATSNSGRMLFTSCLRYTSSIKSEWNLHMLKTESNYHNYTLAAESGKKAMQEVLLNWYKQISKERLCDCTSMEENLRIPDGKLLKQASGDAKQQHQQQQHQQQQHLIRASSVYEAAVSDSRSTLSRLLTETK
ncbi:hypothetical protein DY000_02059710, partial [Brassica cretica]